MRRQQTLEHLRIGAGARPQRIGRIFTPELIRNLTLTKRQELHYIAELSPEEVIELYLDTV